MKPKHIPDENGFIPGRRGGKLKPQQKGTPGHNPKGRPKGIQNRDTVVRNLMSIEMEWKNPITNENERLTIQEMMVLKQIKKSIDESDTQSYKLLNDDAFGKLKESIEKTNNHNHNHEKLSSDERRFLIDKLKNELGINGTYPENK